MMKQKTQKNPQENKHLNSGVNLDLTLEHLSAAIDDEDALPHALLDKNTTIHAELNAFWQATHAIKMQMQFPEFKAQLNTLPIMQALEQEPSLSTAHTVQKVQRKKLSLHHVKKWLGLSLPVGITALFMGLSIGTHNMHAFKQTQLGLSSLSTNGLEDNNHKAYFNLHQQSDARPYGLMNIASNDDSDSDMDEDYIEVAYSQPYAR